MLSARTLAHHDALKVLPWTVLAVIVATRLLSSDVFLDGVVYATVSRNLARGLGSLWEPFYNVLHPRFWQHPPLAIWFEAGLFHLFGDEIWVERVAGVLLAVFSVFLVGRHCPAVSAPSRISNERGSAITTPTDGWLPRLLLVSFPGFTWCACNNMLENQLTVLALTGTALLVCPIESFPRGPAGNRAFGFGTAVGLALLTKGPQAGFLLLAPAALRLEGLSWRRVLSVYLAMILGILAVLGIAVAADPRHAAQFLSEYTSTQLRPSILGQRELAPMRGYLALVIAANLSLPVLLTAILCGWRRPRSFHVGVRFYLAMAVAASLPTVLLEKQMAWYPVPSYPYWALALSCCVPTVHSTSWVRRGLGMMNLTITATAMVLFAQRNAFDRSVDIELRDRFRSLMGHGRPDPRQSEYCWHFFRKDVLGNPSAPHDILLSSRFGTCDQRSVAYAARHLRLSLTARPVSDLLLVEQLFPRLAPVNCESLGPADSRYELFRCHETHAPLAR